MRRPAGTPLSASVLTASASAGWLQVAWGLRCRHAFVYARTYWAWRCPRTPAAPMYA